MKFDEAVRTVVNKYATFTGRAGRPEYWYWVLLLVLVQVAVNIGAQMIGAIALAGTLFSLATLVPTIAVAIRRMHDVGKSGWFILIPLYNLYLEIQPSQSGANAYGESTGAAVTA